jgi:hypothetical protein
MDRLCVGNNLKSVIHICFTDPVLLPIHCAIISVKMCRKRLINVIKEFSATVMSCSIFFPHHRHQ